MRKLRIFHSVLLLLQCLIVAVAHPQQALAIGPDPKSTIERLYEAYDVNVTNGKLSATFTRYAQAFVMIDPKGNTQSLNDIKSKAQIASGPLISTQTHQITGFLPDPNGKGTTVLVTIHNLFKTGVGEDRVCRDYWILTKAGWLLKKERVVSVEASPASNSSTIAVENPAPIVPQPLVAVNVGGGSAGYYATDAHYDGASSVYSTGSKIDISAVTDPAPQSVYQTERVGNFKYTFSNLSPNTTYLVRLHFSEDYWSQVGQRIFDVIINGVPVLNNFDIVAAAGAEYKAVIETVTSRSSVGGKIVVEYVSVVDAAAGSGIEIFDAPATVTKSYAAYVRSGFSQYEGEPFRHAGAVPATLPVRTPHYTLEPLPTPPGDLMHSGSMNNYGQIVGRILTTNTAFLWTNGRILMPFGVMDKVAAINDNGQVAGRDMMWDPDFGITTLSRLPGYPWLEAESINNKVQVVGYALTSSVAGKQNDLTLPALAFLWEKGNIKALEIPPGYKAARAYHINSSGVVAGWLLTENNQTHATIWKNGKAEDIGTFAGGGVSIATCINDAGQVVGAAQHSDGTVTAFLWQNGVMYDLGKFDDDDKSRAYYINNLGQVVGSSFSGDINNFKNSRGFIWDSAHGMRDVVELLSVDSDLKSQMEGSTSVYSINDIGEIMGIYRPQDGSRNMFLLLPGR